MKLKFFYRPLKYESLLFHKLIFPSNLATKSYGLLNCNMLFLEWINIFSFRVILLLLYFITKKTLLGFVAFFYNKFFKFLYLERLIHTTWNRSQACQAHCAIPFTQCSWMTTCRAGEQIVVVRDGWGGGSDYNKVAGGTCGTEMFCVLTVVWPHKSTHVIQLYRPWHTHTHACHTGAIWIRGWITSMQFPAYASFVRSYHWGKLGKGSTGFLCIMSYNCMRIYNHFKIEF